MDIQSLQSGHRTHVECKQISGDNVKLRGYTAQDWKKVGIFQRFWACLTGRVAYTNVKGNDGNWQKFVIVKDHFFKDAKQGNKLDTYAFLKNISHGEIQRWSFKGIDAMSRGPDLGKSEESSKPSLLDQISKIDLNGDRAERRLENLFGPEYDAIREEVVKDKKAAGALIGKIIGEDHPSTDRKTCMEALGFITGKESEHAQFYKALVDKHCG